MSEPQISVVLPVFNGARTLAESLQSLQAQTFKDFEVIIIDDGSTDATGEIARGFCAEDSRFILISQPNQGVSAARNAGIAKSGAGWIALQDADDVWLPEKLERQWGVAQRFPSTNFIFTNLVYWDGERELYAAYDSRKPLPEGDPMRRLIFADVYGTSTLMIKRELLAAAGSFDVGLRLSQDWDLWLRLGEIGLNARGVREPMVRYRRWPGSNTTRRLDVADANVALLEKNLGTTKNEEFRRLYRRSLASARAIRELVKAYSASENNPRAQAAATLRAWKCERRLKWLRWYLLIVWPAILGGEATRRMVQRKYEHVCRGY